MLLNSEKMLFICLLLLGSVAAEPCSSINGPFCSFINGLNTPDYFGTRTFSNKIAKDSLFKLKALKHDELTNLKNDVFNINDINVANNGNGVGQGALNLYPGDGYVATDEQLNEEARLAETIKSVMKQWQLQEKTIPPIRGSYALQGQVSGKKIHLKAGDWVQKPEGQWSSVGLVGQVDDDFSTMEVKLVDENEKHYPDCTNAVLKRNVLRADRAKADVSGDWSGEYSCNGNPTQVTVTLVQTNNGKGAQIITGEFFFVVQQPRKSMSFNLDLGELHLDLDLGNLLQEHLQQENVDLEQPDVVVYELEMNGDRVVIDDPRIMEALMQQLAAAGENPGVQVQIQAAAIKTRHKSEDDSETPVESHEPSKKNARPYEILHFSEEDDEEEEIED